MLNDLLDMARGFAPELVAMRRDLHMHPELGFNEYRTAGIVADTLRALDIEVRTGVAQTGVVGVLRGQGNGMGRTVALRADIDALPIEDRKNLSYSSTVPGVCHACGHDAHTTMLLGAARMLAGMRGRLGGNVVFLFQPAEEGPGGAKPMIEAGALDDPKVDAVFGQHTYNVLDAGNISIRSGAAWAAADEINIDIIGRAAHAAYPHSGIDAMVATAQVITALQSVISRELDPLQTAVLTLGTIHGGHRRNIITERIRLEGTVRTINPDVRKQMPEKIGRIVRGITEGLGATGILDYDWGYPPVVNDPAATDLVRRVGKAMLGEDHVVEQPEPSMGGEDFAFYLQQVPGCFYRLGTGKPGVQMPSGHTPTFDINEDSLPTGAAMLAGIAAEYIANGM